MKKTLKLFSIISGLALIVIYFIACEPKEPATEKYDIKYNVAQITGLLPYTIEGEDTIYTTNVEDTLTILGKNLDDPTLALYLPGISNAYSGLDATVISISSDTIKVIVPRRCTQGRLRVRSYYTDDSRADEYSKMEFVPIVPSTTITSIPDTLFKQQSFIITGTNLDMITKIDMKDFIITGTGSYAFNATNTTLTMPSAFVQTLNFSGTTASVNFLTRALDKFVSKDITIMNNFPQAVVGLNFPDSVAEGDDIYLNVVPVADFQYTKYISLVEVWGGKIKKAGVWKEVWLTVTPVIDDANKHIIVTIPTGTSPLYTTYDGKGTLVLANGQPASTIRITTAYQASATQQTYTFRIKINP